MSKRIGIVSNNNNNNNNKKGDGDIWHQNFVKLKEFVKENGHFSIPFNGSKRMLAKWAGRQRQRKALKEEQRRLLTEIGYPWSLDDEATKYDRAWTEIFLRLKKFKNQEGHVIVPQTYDLDPELGIWVANQRKLNNRGKLKPKRFQQLEEIGFEWRVRVTTTNMKNRIKQKNEKYDTQWKQMFQKLKDYKDKHGHVNVPFSSIGEEKSLGLWVSTQRREFHKRSWYGNQIREERRDLLESIGFSWVMKGTKKETASLESKEPTKKDQAKTKTKTKKRLPKRKIQEVNNQSKTAKPRTKEVQNESLPTKPKMQEVNNQSGTAKPKTKEVNNQSRTAKPKTKELKNQSGTAKRKKICGDDNGDAKRQKSPEESSSKLAPVPPVPTVIVSLGIYDHTRGGETEPKMQEINNQGRTAKSKMQEVNNESGTAKRRETCSDDNGDDERKKSPQEPSPKLAPVPVPNVVVSLGIHGGAREGARSEPTPIIIRDTNTSSTKGGPDGV